MGYPFSTDFQRGILGLASRSPTFLRHVRSLIQPDMFQLRGHQVLADLVLKHFDKTGNPPSKADLMESLRLAEEPDWAKAGVAEELREMYEEDAIDEDGAEEKVRKHASEAAVRTVCTRIDDYLGGVGVPDFLADLKRAAAISSREAALQSYGEGIADRIRAYTTGEVRKNAVPTGFRRVDAAMGGGLCPGELAVTLGLLGTGKSQWLVNVGCGAMEAGKKVMHVSLEMGYLSTLRRYDQRLSGCRAKDMTPQQAEDLHKKWNGLLNVVVAPAYRLPVSAIESRIERMKPDERPDLVVVDYGMLLSGEGDNDPRPEARRHVLGRVYADLRALAIEKHVGVWTAIQANRKGYEAPILTSQHVAECFEALQHADVTMSINQTQAEVIGKKLRLWIEKNRDEQSKVLVPFLVDWSRSMMQEDASG